MADAEAADLSGFLDSSAVRRYCGFGMAQCADGFRLAPTSDEEVVAAFHAASELGRQLVLRGAGRSYGDAAIGAECLIVENAGHNRILHWDPGTGMIEAEGGALLSDVWRKTLPDGWWLPVTSGTMFVSLAGALAMNVHGKNHLQAGSLAEHVVSIDVILPDGSVRTVDSQDDLYTWIVGSAGLLAYIARVRLQMHKVSSGLLSVKAVSCGSWDEQFAAFDDLGPQSDYLVSWVDLFPGTGRGLVHAANYLREERPDTLAVESQDLPDRILGIVPKSQVWRALKPLNNSRGMRAVNAAKAFAAARLEHGKTYPQSLAEFSYLLDYVPDWRKAYLPHGFLQFQPFVPREAAPAVFQTLNKMQRASGTVAFLGVLKRHRPDQFPLSWALDGYSLAMDFKIPANGRRELTILLESMTDVVLEAGGRFYWAKDSSLRPVDVERYLGRALQDFRAIKHRLDPQSRLTSSLAQRTRLFQG